MSATRKITVELPEDVAVRVEQRLEAGTYGSESDIVAASLTAQLDSDDQLDRWVKGDLENALEAWRAAPEKVRSVDEVFDGALARYEARKAREA